jgi:hypothetical protein
MVVGAGGLNRPGASLRHSVVFRSLVGYAVHHFRTT